VARGGSRRSAPQLVELCAPQGSWLFESAQKVSRPSRGDHFDLLDVVPPMSALDVMPQVPWPSTDRVAGLGREQAHLPAQRFAVCSPSVMLSSLSPLQAWPPSVAKARCWWPTWLASSMLAPYRPVDGLIRPARDHRFWPRGDGGFDYQLPGRLSAPSRGSQPRKPWSMWLVENGCSLGVLEFGY